MKPRTYPASRRLGVAVAVVLAVAAGALTVVPAAAAPTALPAEAAALREGLLPLPAGEIVGAGTSGYLVRDARTYANHWVRFDTGAVTKLPYVLPYFVQGSDSVVEQSDAATTTVRDMTTGRVVLTVDDSRLYGASFWGAVGSTLFTTVGDETTGQTLSLFRPGANGTVARTVATGLPDDASAIWPESVKGTSVTLAYKSGGKQYRAALDLASGAVSGAKVVVIPADALFRDPGDMSPTLRAWMTQDAAAKVSLVLEDRRTAARRSLALGQPSSPVVRVIGDWALYADDRMFFEPSPLQALRARSFAGAEFKLLDTYRHAVREPDGTLLVQGGRLDRGEGLFRIRAGADGKPVATMIASSGLPVKLVLSPSTIPSTIDLDKNRGQANLDWTLSRLNAQVKVVLRHRRTGKTATRTIAPSYDDYVAPRIARLRWDGLLDSGERAFNGAYDWQFTATPLDKLGPAVSASGSFTVTRKVNPRDLNDNGSPDLLVREGNGTLTRLDTVHSAGTPGTGAVRQTIGSGWQVYDRIEATGNLGGTAVGDLVARDRAGVLWLYQGTGRGNYATRLRIGGGWQAYDKLTGGSDVTGDGRNDLLAADKAGVLWAYPGTGDARAPFAARKRVGGGWSGYDRVAATGDLAGGPAGDLVARDRAGVLWLYLGKGDGAFAARTRIGGGWGGYKDITGAADVNSDGRNDLVGFDGLDNFVHPGTGNWKAPLASRRELGSVPYEPNLLA